MTTPRSKRRSGAILTSQEEDEITSRRASLKRLGAKLNVMLVRCPSCGNDYHMGSRHKGSAWCMAVTLQKDLTAQGLACVPYTYKTWLAEAGIAFSSHNTGLRRTGKGYMGAGEPPPETRLWTIKAAAQIVMSTSLYKVDRMKLLAELQVT